MRPQTNAVFLYSRQTEKYHYPDECPFKAERAGRAREIVASMGLLTVPGVAELEPEAAERTDLETFHVAAYIDALESAAHGDYKPEHFSMGLGTPDCPVFADMYDYAALACGATLTGARLILDGKACLAFNPSGGFHHAGPAHAAGFCYLNDVVLACLVFAKAGMKILMLDLDAHHGDGTQAAFYDRDDVLFISFHENGHTIYPGTGFEDEIGAGDGQGYTVNVPLPPDTYDEAYLNAFLEITIPLVTAYDPDVVVVELGMDALADDPLTHLGLTNNAYATTVEKIVDFGKPVLATGGGGYHAANTARGWALLWKIMTGARAIDEASLGLGGIMLESVEWQGGLQDRMRIPTVDQRSAVEPAVARTIARIKKNIFPYHGI